MTTPDPYSGYPLDPDEGPPTRDLSPPGGGPLVGEPRERKAAPEPRERKAGREPRERKAGRRVADAKAQVRAATVGGPGRRAAAGEFRPRRTAAATVTALLLAAAALVTVVAAVAAMWRGRSHVPPLTWLTPLGRTHWNDPAAITTAAVVCLLGLLLLALALTPGRARVLALASEDQQTVTGITRSGLSRHLASVAARVDGVSRARVRFRGDSVQVNAATPLREVGELPGQVIRAVTARLEELRPLRPMRVRVHVRQREE
ncbi:DUF6286 domain-containing protein [Sphaerisporangium corydalis]|uniref:DUF6286 domain-containing protein n=1 Tax=Sphaerisporangium corydalis TaxID=1441875 RepID=A0ABV9EBI8_9ACTN|nr:DUF6286 domain-containing protein [Sphaerisporangium corydalis]